MGLEDYIVILSTRGVARMSFLRGVPFENEGGSKNKQLEQTVFLSAIRNLARHVNVRGPRHPPGPFLATPLGYVMNSKRGIAYCDKVILQQRVE